MPESLFNEYEAQTALGNQFAQEVENALTPIILRWAVTGYKLRELCDITQGVVAVIISEEVLRKAMRLSKQERLKGA